MGVTSDIDVTNVTRVTDVTNSHARDNVTSDKKVRSDFENTLVFCTFAG